MRSAVIVTALLSTASASLLKRWDWYEITPARSILDGINVTTCVPSCDAAAIKRLDDCDDDDKECACSDNDWNTLVACANCVISLGATDRDDREDAHEILDDVRKRCGTRLAGELGSITATGAATSGAPVPTGSITSSAAADAADATSAPAGSPTQSGTTQSGANPAATPSSAVASTVTAPVALVLGLVIAMAL